LHSVERGPPPDEGRSNGGATAPIERNSLCTREIGSPAQDPVPSFEDTPAPRPVDAGTRRR